VKPVSAKLLALALTAIEGERFRCIHATEYIAYEGGLQSDYPNLLEAMNLNIRVMNWVRSSIHHSRTDTAKNRIETIGQFVETAKVNVGQTSMAWLTLITTFVRE
jgi:hypothetical protein